MDTTTFLAQLWGPAILAVGLGVFVSRKNYIKIYRDLQKETLAILLFGMVGIIAGLAQIHFHNVWGSLSQIIISFLGWALLLKGLMLAIAPGIVDKIGDWQADSKLIPIAGVLMLIVGAYLSWVGYFI
ncbi:MAG: hypothetical protein IT410_02115 [Candidatus Doudnabacteria bacterium]|nr:hypothetical protein [Candidatus Doudnabacteria bacterium]